ncbi:MAG: UvrD-helicase domain-containing protein [Alphaproteobacteria bacterium]|nr:UvrD-helicase domain-containing protein [Alphaproteobacteria bacterium]
MNDIFKLDEPETDFNPLDEAVDEFLKSSIPEPSFIDDLNPEQRQAVETTEGPVLVLSGAGTGKTKVLTTRVAYIIHQKKALPWQILAVTFTNKASKEMKSRLERLIGADAFSVWLGTFHAIGIKILRKFAEKVNLTSNFIVLGTDDQERLLKNLMQEAGVDIKKYTPAGLLEIIQRWKDKGLLPEQVTSAHQTTFCNGRALYFYKQYQQKLSSLNAVDFGDLLLLPLALFQSHPDILAHYQQQFKYILVDEYQDTNVAQYLLLRLLAKKYNNICCVGDDDQSIYSWRGAKVENILNFKTTFPDAVIIRLERNYRSTRHILGAASGLIANNSGRLGKTLKPANEKENQGEHVLVKGFYNGNQEAEYIVETIESEQKKGVLLSDMAILVRATFQTRLFEEVLMRHGVSYKIIGGFKFYEREEIKDAIAYLRLILNTDDDLAFMRIVNKPKRGIGPQAMDALEQTTREKHISLFDAIGWASLRPAVRKTLDSFVLTIKRARELLQTESPADVAKTLLEESGYIQMWRLDKSPEAEGRLENIRELYTVLSDFEDIQSFIEYTSLVMDTDENVTDDQLVVMTLHASKGLEFYEVFLAGWEEGLFPHQKTLDETGDVGLEEERRLAYVGMTRAKRKLTISFAHNRRMYGQWINALPSRFIEELPQQHIQTDTYFHRSEQQGYQASTPAWGCGYSGSRKPKRYGTHVQSFDFDDDVDTQQDERPVSRWDRESLTSTPSDYFIPRKQISYRTVASSSSRRVGRRVRHETFGAGTVVREDGERLDIRFDSGQIKKIMARFLEEE